MPMYINQSGIAVCVEPEYEDKARHDGLRLATEEDMQWARADKSRFALPRVDGIQRGELGGGPVVVVGNGPSSKVETPGMTRVQVNPRDDSLPADFAIALDGIYWALGHWPIWHERNPKARYFAPRCVHTYGCQPQPESFNMPVRAIKGQPDDYLEIRTQNGIQKAHFTGICAVLFAQYLSDGPIILSGFDLAGDTHTGTNYATHQGPAWKAACQLWSNVFCHPSMTGPIREWLPVWEGTNGRS